MRGSKPDPAMAVMAICPGVNPVNAERLIVRAPFAKVNSWQFTVDIWKAVKQTNNTITGKLERFILRKIPSGNLK